MINISLAHDSMVPHRSVFRWGGLMGAVLFLLGALMGLHGQVLTVVNPSFEDTSGQAVFNEFTLGVPAGWQLYNPSGLTFGVNNFTGTLDQPENAFFDEPAPDGSRVLILFNRDEQGAGTYGVQQTLSATLLANTRYQVTVAVGNIGSGTAQSTEFFNLDGFPGYRVELLADPNPGTVGDEFVLASDNDTLSISERTFADSKFTYDSGPAPAHAGLALGLRLLNLNQPLGLPLDPDSEVDFDRVQLAVVPEPNGASVMALVAVAIYAARRWGQARRAS